jgi:hypothetical protein
MGQISADQMTKQIRIDPLNLRDPRSIFDMFLIIRILCEFALARGRLREILSKFHKKISSRLKSACGLAD